MKIPHIVCLLLASAIAPGQEILTLPDAIRAARSQRPALEAARLRVAQAELSRRALSAYPSTRLMSGYSTDLEVGGSDDDLVLAQPVDIFGRTAAGRAAGSALIAQAEAAYRQVAGQVQAEVVDAYVAAAMSAELAKSAASVQETLERLYQATRQRVEGGVAPGVQLTRVGLELDQAKLRTARLEAERKANLTRLSALIGAEAIPVIAAGFPAIPVASADDESLMRNRSDLLVLAAEARVAEADSRLVRASSRPELELQARRTPWQQSDDRYGLRLQLSIPLLDYGRARAETRAAETRAEAARKALTDATRLAKGEVAAARIELDSAAEQVSQYEQLVATARQLVDRLRPALTEQATTMLDVIDATRALRDSEVAFVEAKQRLAEAQARYLRATGQLMGAEK